MVPALLAGCLAPSVRPAHGWADPFTHEHESRCARSISVYSPYRMPLAQPLDDPERAVVLSSLPPEARRTAGAAGLEPLLAELFAERAALAGTEASARLLALGQELNLRLLAFDSQVSALAFETTCTRERVADLLVALQRRESQRQLSLATASLVLGATAGVTLGVWDLRGRESNVPAMIGMGTAVATVALGSAALLQPQRSVVLEHRHNLLRPLIQGSDPEHFFPTFVFRMLTFPDPSRGYTPRDELLAVFHTLLPERKREAAERILLGEGGIYERRLLELRHDLLHALEVAVQGVARELELLDRALVRQLGKFHGSSPLTLRQRRTRHQFVTALPSGPR